MVLQLFSIHIYFNGVEWCCNFNIIFKFFFYQNTHKTIVTITMVLKEVSLKPQLQTVVLQFPLKPQLVTVVLQLFLIPTYFNSIVILILF